jgi:cysteine desulfurase/selenocysteine lyase
MLDVNKIREDFPILSRQVYGKPLVYLDNAATTQKPKQVIDKIAQYYNDMNSNIHRGVHYLSQISTDEYEKTRVLVQKFINARHSEEIIFTKGTTDSINLVASSFGKAFIKEGDEIIITGMEHHSNIVPWQILCEDKGCSLKVVPLTDSGEITIEDYKSLFSSKTKFVSLNHISNSLGTVNPVKEMIKIAHSYNVPVLIDGAQSIQHMPVNVLDLDCDFYAFSGHKLYAPTGVGVLYGKKELLEKLPPYQGGGDMILSVSFEKTIFNVLPYKFEAGTPNIEGVIALGTAIQYVQSIGLDNIMSYEKELLDYATDELNKIQGLRIIGTAKNKASLISFVLENVHPHDVGTFLDREGVAVRTGHHCTEPVMHRFNVPATSRASFAFYNTKDEIDTLVRAINKVIKMFS